MRLRLSHVEYCLCILNPTLNTTLNPTLNLTLFVHPEPQDRESQARAEFEKNKKERQKQDLLKARQVWKMCDSVGMMNLTYGTPDVPPSPFRPHQDYLTLKEQLICPHLMYPLPLLSSSGLPHPQGAA